MRHIHEYISDEELLQLYLKEGDPADFTELYRRYMPLVYGVALKYLQRPQDAQDAVMHLYEELLVKVRQHPVQHFKPWLYACVRNYCLAELRKKSRRLSVELDPAVMDFCDDFRLDKEKAIEERQQAVQECLDQLPEKQRICLYEFFWNEISYKEIEEKTGFSLKKVKSFIQNGKRNMKNCLEKKGTRPHETE